MMDRARGKIGWSNRYDSSLCTAGHTSTTQSYTHTPLYPPTREAKATMLKDQLLQSPPSTVIYSSHSIWLQENVGRREIRLQGLDTGFGRRPANVDSCPILVHSCCSYKSSLTKNYCQSWLCSYSLFLFLLCCVS